MTTYLVTGGAGFIGSHLCDRFLAQEGRVIAIDDLSTGRIANLAEARGYGAAFTFYNMDARSEKLPALFDRHRPEVVVHLATGSTPGGAIADPVADAEVNVLGTLRLMEECSRTGVRKFVYAVRGDALYGEAKKLPVSERALSSTRPRSPDGVSRKAVLEYLSVFERYRGLEWVALALASVYGPRQDPAVDGGAVADLATLLLAGEVPTILGDGNQTRDFVFVSDVAHAFALASDRGHGRVVNVGTGKETSVNTLYRMLCGITGAAPTPVAGPLPSGHLRRSALDPSLAAEVLGWRPWTHLEDGLGETVAYLRGI